MNLEEVFPRASIEEKEYTIEKIERLLGDNNEVLLNYDNGDYLDDIEHIFEIIKNTVSIVLKIAMRPFMFKHKKHACFIFHHDTMKCRIKCHMETRRKTHFASFPNHVRGHNQSAQCRT